MQSAPVDGFRHEAVLYEGESGFVDRIAPFVREGIEAGLPTLVVVGRSRIDVLRDVIDESSGLLEYRDMEVIGANPACIIPVWDEFAMDQIGRGAQAIRGVGEPIWPGRTALELEECHWHEALINQAFADVRGLWFVCPYDVSALTPAVVSDARRTHPIVSGADHDPQPASPISTASPRASAFAPADHLLVALVFGVTDLPTLRGVVAEQGARAGLSAMALDDFVLAVSEVATNSLLYGGGTGVVRMFLDAGDLVCEVVDSGVITDSLADRRRPGSDPQHARGLWTANRLCDLVQIRSSPERGTAVRLRMHTRGRAA